MQQTAGDSFAARALAAVQQVVAQASAQGLRVSVAVVDAGGHLVSYHRMQGVPYQLVQIAIDKAATAAGFGMQTAHLRDFLAQMPAEVTQAFTVRPGICLLGGGAPIKADEVILGAIGVSGGTEAQDSALASAAIHGG